MKDHSRKVNAAAGKTSRYQPPQNDYGSMTMPRTIATREGDGGRQYPGKIPRQEHGDASMGGGGPSGDRSRKVATDSRSRPTPTAGNAGPVSGGTSSRPRVEGGRRGRLV